MGKPTLPDHEGRMPDHPRYGNPSDPAEEQGRIRGAHENLENWSKRYGGEFSGGVSMSYGGKDFHVPIGDREIGQKIVGRPIASQPRAVLPEPAEAAPESILPPVTPPPQFWLWRLLNRIKGAFQ